MLLLRVALKGKGGPRKKARASPFAIYPVRTNVATVLVPL